MVEIDSAAANDATKRTGRNVMGAKSRTILTREHYGYAAKRRPTRPTSNEIGNSISIDVSTSIDAQGSDPFSWGGYASADHNSILTGNDISNPDAKRLIDP